MTLEPHPIIWFEAARLLLLFLHRPAVTDVAPEYDCVFHQGEEHQQHAGEEPDLHGSHCVGHGNTSSGGEENDD